MTNDTIITLIALGVTLFAGGFLLSIPMMKRQYREHLGEEESWHEKEKTLNNKVYGLKSKVTKWKDKFKKKKKK